ncbi:nitroreductase family protein [Candidatus Bathyarchaeota archaeon]|nr:nitroreductase family protein [Candidatus Bathyarchaeota archaeon]
MSTVLKYATKRRTIRKFDSNPINIEDVLMALKIGAQAPSGANYQPWRFIIIDDPKLKRRIREASEDGEKEFYKKVSGDWAEWLESKKLNPSKPFLEEAPLLVVVLAQNGIPYSTESVWTAIGYILLALEELNLSTVTYTPSDTKRVLEVLNVPETFRLEAILPIGKSNDTKIKEPRYEISDLVRFNNWHL